MYDVFLREKRGYAVYYIPLFFIYNYLLTLLKKWSSCISLRKSKSASHCSRVPRIFTIESENGSLITRDVISIFLSAQNVVMRSLIC